MKSNNSVGLSYRVLSIILCVIMLFSLAAALPAVSAYDTDTVLYSNGDNSYVAEIGAGLNSSAESIFSENYSITKPVSVKTKVTRFVQETIPRYNHRYAIMHAASGNVMCYDPTNPTASATSLVYNQDAAVYNSYTYDNTNGVINNDVIYFDNSLRDSALWVLRQLKHSNYGNTDIQNNDELSHINNGSETMGHVDTTAVRYHHSIFFKGIGPVRNASGVVTDPVNGAYWSSVNDADAVGVQERFLFIDTDDMFKETDVFNDSEGNKLFDARTLIIEKLTDGTFFIYRRSLESPYEYYFLTCDPDDGTWGVKYFSTRTEAREADWEPLKLRLYRYENGGVNRTLSVSGDQKYHILEGTSKEDVIDYLSNSLTVFDTSVNNQQVGFSGTESKIGYYWLSFDNEFDSSANRTVSDYVVKINYCNEDGQSTVIGAVSLSVYSTMPIKCTASEIPSAGVVVQNANLGAVVQMYSQSGSKDCTFNIMTKSTNGVQTSVVPVTVGMLTDSQGNNIDTSVNGVYSGLTLTYAGEVIATNFTLTVEDSSDVLNYPDYPEEGSVRVNKTGKTVGAFKENGVANIQLGATGIPVAKGVDIVVVLDLSGSMNYAFDRAAAATDGETSRVQALQDSLKSMITTLKSSGVDFRIAMSDFGDIDAYEFDGAYLDPTIKNKFFFDGDCDGEFDQRATWRHGSRREFYNHLNYVHGDYQKDVEDEAGNIITDYDNRAMPSNISEKKYNSAFPGYTGKVIPNVYTGSRRVNADAFVPVTSLDDSAISSLLDEIAENQKHSLGTNYDVGLEYAYQLGYSIQQENIKNGQDRELLCVFMSDGCAMQYNYFSGRTVSQAWADWLNADIDIDKLQHDLFTEISDSPNLVSLMGKMLNKLKKGTLKRPDYKLAYTPVGTSSNTVASLMDYVKKEVDGVSADYFDLTAEGTQTAETFYSAMSLNGIILQWETVCAIADANGLKGYSTMADVESELLALAQSNMLKYPSGNPEFYDAYTGTSTDLFTAMSEMGIPCNWEHFVQIAQINGYDTQLQNAYEDVTILREGMSWGTLSPYYYFYNEGGKSWMAEAIKGNSNQLYPVINKYAFAASEEQPYTYYGDVRNGFSTGTGLALDGKDYISGYRGLDMPIYTVGFSLCTEQYLSEQTAKTVLQNIASGPGYAFTANTKEELMDVFGSIAVSASQAATRAYYIDTLGPEYDLYTKKTVVSDNGEVITINADTVIYVYEYTLDPVTHQRTGNPVVLETVTISENADGSLSAKSDKIYNIITDENGVFIPEYPNIFTSDGVITAKNFRYNTNKYVSETENGSVKIDLTGDSVGDFTLPAESFFWILGPLGETELVLDYNVYLEGSLEGKRLPGVYETNTSAKLYYVNYLGNNCVLDTVSPELAWPGAVVGYGFYLADENGNPLSADGAITDFENAQKLTEPIYTEISLNGETVDVVPGERIPELLSMKYSLYDSSAQYRITFSTIPGSSNWVITKGSDVNASTYVANYGYEATTLDSSSLTYDDILFDRSVVWFALNRSFKANPDTVVIDYGLPVEVDVLSNDVAFESDYTLYYVDNTDAVISGYNAAVTAAPDLSLDAYLQSLSVSQETIITSSSAQGLFGSVVKNDDLIRYTPDKSNGMQMSKEDTFVYAAYYASADNTEAQGFYYSTLTVIPATSIYYEDNFVNYNVYDHYTAAEITADNPHYSELKWSVEGTQPDALQAQDRPGNYVLPELDAGNIYGYDKAYSAVNTYSLGSAHKVNVGKHTFEDGTTQNTRATANFSFTGTGFDVISLTSNTTGTVIVQVAGKGNVAGVNKYYMVDTYYGYKYDTETNQWVVDVDADNALYQIPVIKVVDLPYGKYDVTLSVAYAELFDHQQYGDAQNFDFYLDAIRIYDPANDGEGNTVIENAYIADSEGWPIYKELRNLILKAESFGSTQDNRIVNGAVFIDNTAREEGVLPSLSDYSNYGPNNEVYLAPGQAIAFELSGENIKSAHIAMKSVNNSDVSVKVFNAALNHENVKSTEIKTATDLYYDITRLNSKVVVIYNCSNNSDSILSVTNIKMTFAAKPAENTSVEECLKMSVNMAQLALTSLETLPEPVTTAPTEPATTVPTEPVTKAPTEPVTTVPTEPATKAPTEPATKAPTEPATKAPTEPATKAPTEPATKAPTEPATKAPTEPVTTAPSVPSVTQEVTEQQTTTVVNKVLLGDANLDSVLNIKDATTIQKYVAELISLESDALKAADYNKDDIVNIKDATCVQKTIAGLI